MKERKKFLSICEISDVEGYVQKHHLFRKNIRRGKANKEIELQYVKDTGDVVKVKIQMNVTINVSDDIHKLIHPENLNYHLNALVVKSLKKDVQVKANLNNVQTVVSQAIIEIIKPQHLKVGDIILWSKYQCKVISIPDRKGCFCEILQDENDENSVMKLPRYLVFHKIIKVVN